MRVAHAFCLLSVLSAVHGGIHSGDAHQCIAPNDACCSTFVNLTTSLQNSCCTTTPGELRSDGYCNVSSCTEAFGFPNDAKANCNPHKCPGAYCNYHVSTDCQRWGTIACEDGSAECFAHGYYCVQDGCSENFKLCGGADCNYTEFTEVQACNATTCNSTGYITLVATRESGNPHDCPNITKQVPCQADPCPLECTYSEGTTTPCNATCEVVDGWIVEEKTKSDPSCPPQFKYTPCKNNSCVNTCGDELCWDGLKQYKSLFSKQCECPKRCPSETNNPDCPVDDPSKPFDMVCRPKLFPRVPIPAPPPATKCVGRPGKLCCKRPGVPFNYNDTRCDDGTGMEQAGNVFICPNF